MERITASAFALYLVAKRQDEDNEAEFGTFNLDQYSHEMQMAMLVMRFNDPLAKAVLMRLHSSTVAGKDFDGLKRAGLAVWNGAKQLHDFTPRGRWISLKVTKALAERFEVTVPQQHIPETAAERARRERGQLNWANR